MIPTAVLDATLLSNFAHVRRPDLLRLALGESAVTTPTVMAELQTGEALGLVPRCDWARLTVLEPSDEEHRLALYLRRQLDPGEAECLAVAQMRQCTFLSDDFAARRLARQHKLTVSGTLGILLVLVDDKRLSQEEADGLLAIMISHGYRSPVNSLRLLLT